MPALTRRRYPRRPNCWHVYYGDVHVGTIAERAGVPVNVDQWGWSYSFYPGRSPGEHLAGTAVDFDHARAEFNAAWRIYSAKRTEADYQTWRDQRDQTVRKYAMWARGEKLPSQIPSSMITCPCGERFDSHDPEHSYVHRQHIYARDRNNEIRRNERIH